MQVASRDPVDHVTVVARVTKHPWPTRDARWHRWIPQRYEHVLESAGASILLVVAVWHDQGTQAGPAAALIFAIALGFSLLALPVVVLAVRRIDTPALVDNLEIGVPKMGQFVVYGMPSEIARTQATAQAMEMEPVVFSRLRLPTSAASWGASYAAAGLATYFVLRSHPKLWLIGFLLLLTLPQVVIFLGLLAHSICPTYYRISPCKIEILSGQLFGSSVRVETTIELQHRAVIARFDARCMIVLDANGGSTTIQLDGIAEPHAFVERTAWALVATKSLAPLPDDRLLG